jgi:F420-non-reducing hydrogenase iron-sulfur subunit
LAGVSRQQYASNTKIVRVMCTGRVDLAFIFRALLNGKDGVFIGGCHPGECHYLTQGNYGALSTLHIGRKLLEAIGLNPERLRLEYISASEGSRYAQVMNDFSTQVKELGPLGKGEGIDETVLRRKLEVVYNLVPYIRLVERERLRMPVKSVEAYNEFFGSDEFNKIFEDLIADKMEISQIMAILREQPCSAKEISEILGVTPGEASSQLKRSARQGFVEFDESHMRFCVV